MSFCVKCRKEVKERRKGVWDAGGGGGGGKKKERKKVKQSDRKRVDERTEE